MSWSLKGKVMTEGNRRLGMFVDVLDLEIDRIPASAFGIEYEGRAGISAAEFAGAA